MKCDYCNSEVESTAIRRKRKEKSLNVFCNRKCYNSSKGHKTGKTKITCKYCSKEFESYFSDKLYCNMTCYNKDPETKERLKKLSKMGTIKRHGKESFAKEIACVNCSKIFKRQPSSISVNNFCKHLCYREYYAKRFDRLIKEKFEISGISNFDEFMLQEEFTCLVDDCEWKGKGLAKHINMQHGIRADEFKKMVGFNIQTGVVPPSTHLKMSKQAKKRGGSPLILELKRNHKRSSYRSKEGVEHIKKAWELNKNKPTGETKTCKNCFKEFEILFGTWGQKYCNIKCRNAFYKKHKSWYK